VFRELLEARHLTDRPPTPIERPEVDRPEGLRAASPPQLLLVSEEPAMPKVAAGSSRLTIPLLAGLLLVAVFVATPVLAMMVLARLWR
jgi:hypothetical protein